MFNTLEKAKEIGTITLDRINDYLELIRVELDIAQQHFVAKLSSLLLMAVMAFFAAIFLGFAIIVSFWDTEYRIAAAWGVAAFWTLAAAACFLWGRGNLKSELELGKVRHAVKQDIQFLKELL
ncbi:MAG TPA: phage holin family protein [Burkholderiaceae bacterium]